MADLVTEKIRPSEAGRTITDQSQGRVPAARPESIEGTSVDSGSAASYAPATTKATASGRTLTSDGATERVRATHDVYRLGSDSSYQETPCFCPASQTHPVGQTLPLTPEPISPEELALWWNGGADLDAVQRLITRVIELGQLRAEVGAVTVQMRAVDVILDNLDHPLFDGGDPRMNVEKVVRALAAAGLFRGGEVT